MNHSKNILLIIEPLFYGHHYTYLENIVQEAYNNGREVIIATQNNLEGDLIRLNICKRFNPSPIIFQFGIMPKPHYFNNFFTLMIFQVKVRSYYKKLYALVNRDYKVGSIFFPYLDDFLHSLSFFGSPFNNCLISGITMRQQFHFDKKNISIKNFLDSNIKKFLFLNLLSLKSIKNIFIIDPTLKDYVNIYSTSFSNKLKYFADPVKDYLFFPKVLARNVLSIPASNLVVLVFGYLDSRKGIDQLFNWALVNNKNCPITILLIGKQSLEIKKLIKSFDLLNQLNLIEKDEFISNLDEPLFFSAADVVWVAYPNFHLMSSVLIKAAQVKSDIIFYDYGLISYFVNRYGSEIQKNSIFIEKGFVFTSGLKVRSFSKSKNNFVLDHSWVKAGIIFFNS